MKKFLLTFVLTIIASLSFAQPRSPFIDFSKYEKVDSFLLEKVEVTLPFEIKESDLPKDAIVEGGNRYLFTLPFSDKMVIKTNSDKSKAIIIRNSVVVGGRINFMFRRHYEYNVEENERRLILWYKDNRTYCGYIYDKELKVCQYFDTKKEYRHFMRRR